MSDNNKKKYLDDSGLSRFLGKLKTIFSPINHDHTVSEITDYVVDEELSPTSTNPVQNKVLDAEFEAMSEAMLAYGEALAQKSPVGHGHNITDVSNLQNELDNKSNIDHEHSWNELNDRPFGEETENTEIVSGVYNDVQSITNDIHTDFVNRKSYTIIINDKSYNVIGDMYFDASGLPGVQLVCDECTLVYQSGYNGEVWYFSNYNFELPVQFELYEISTSTVKIDEKYIPDTIARTSDVDTKLSGKSDTTHDHDDVYDAKGSANSALDQAKAYTDDEIALLLNNSSEAVDSIMELAQAMEENDEVVAALEQAIGVKANATDLSDHVNNKNNPHSVTKAHLGLENVENKSSETIRSELTKDNVTAALEYTPMTPDEVNAGLDAKQDKLTGTEGQIVGFDAEGNAVTTDAPDSGVGKNVEGTIYTINGVEVTARAGAEVFNNYEVNIASGYMSHAEGSQTIASGFCSHAEGVRATASGTTSHAEGLDTVASGAYSHAEGESAIASGIRSHAEGYTTIASGDYSHAEGYDTIASGNSSHAEGLDTTTSGKYSHAEGSDTVANSRSQHVQGEYNVLDIEKVEDRGTFAHIVGNGTSNSSRSNAHTLDWDGNAWFAGDVYVGSTSGVNKDEGSVKLAVVGETATGGDTIYTPKDLSGLESVNTDSGVMYKISDVAPAISDLQNGGIIKTIDGSEITYYLSDYITDEWAAIEGTGDALVLIAYKNNISSDYGALPSAGIYVPADNSGDIVGVASLTINDFTGFPDIKKLDSKYLDFNIDDYKNAILLNKDQQKYYLPTEELKESAYSHIPSNTIMEYDFLGYMNNDEICIISIKAEDESWMYSIPRTCVCSKDGYTWDIFDCDYDLSLNTPFVYGNGMFLKESRIEEIYEEIDEVFTTAVMAYSYDGINWNHYEFPTIPRTCMEYCNDKFIALSGSADTESGIGAYSTDGLSWTSFSTPFHSCMSLASNNNPENPLCVAMTTSGVFYSSDGINWISANTMIGFNAFGCVNNVFIAVGAGGGVGITVYASVDGQNWKCYTMNQDINYPTTDDRYTLTTNGIDRAVIGASTYIEEDGSIKGGFICVEANPNDENLAKVHYSLSPYSGKNYYCINFKNIFIAFGFGRYAENPILYSIDGVNWYYDFPFVDANGDVVHEMVTNQSIHLIDNLYKTKANNIPMTGSTSSDAGTSGLVPAPAAGDENKFLKGDGTWGEADSFFVVHAEEASTAPTVDASFADIQTAIQAGKRVYMEYTTDTTWVMDILNFDDYNIRFSCVNSSNGVYIVITIRNDDVASVSYSYTTSSSYSTSLSSGSWTEESDGSYSQTVTYYLVTATNNISIDCALTGSDKDANIAILQGWGCVNDCKQAEGTLTFYCYGDKPTVNIPLSVVVM